jgi:hypothetical protein
MIRLSGASLCKAAKTALETAGFYDKSRLIGPAAAGPGGEGEPNLAVPVLLLSGALAAVAATLWFAARWQPVQAVVLPETAFLMNGPGAEFTQSLNVHSGNLVIVLREQGDWAEVEALGKVRAWIRRDELMTIP